MELAEHELHLIVKHYCEHHRLELLRNSETSLDAAIIGFARWLLPDVCMSLEDISIEARFKIPPV